MTTKVKTNFEKINGRRIMTFKVSNDGLVLPERYRRPVEDGVLELGELLREFGISARESFRRWKIARKAWATRRKQQELPL